MCRVSIGVEGELRGMPGKVINWMNALSLVTVPGSPSSCARATARPINMGGGRTPTGCLLATADLGFMDPAARSTCSTASGAMTERDRLLKSNATPGGRSRLPEQNVIDRATPATT